jgi:hypothetical protein
MRPTIAAARRELTPTMRSSAVLLGCVALLVTATAAPTPGGADASARATASPVRIAGVRGWNSVRAWHGVQVWTTYGGDRRWHVVVRNRGRISMPAGIPVGDARLRVDVGPGENGKPALAFLRCIKVCRVVVSDLAGGRARTIPGSDGATALTIWGSRVAWVADRTAVLTRTLRTPGIMRLAGAPRRKCLSSRCRRPTGRSVDDLELSGRRLALTTSYTLPEGDQTEVRMQSVRGGPQRLIAQMTVAEGAQFWAGPSWAGGELFFYRSCPFGCDDQGAYRYDPDSGAYAFARKSNTTLAGFAMDDDGRRAFEIPGPVGPDVDTVPTTLRLTAPLMFVRGRSPVPSQR